MESHVKIAGHPIHPMLITLPLGMLTAAVVFDIIYLITGNAIFPAITFYDMIAGVIGGLLAALFGFIDWLNVPSRTRAKSVGAAHGIGNVVLVVLFVISLVLRATNSSAGFVPSTPALAFSFAGIVLGLITAWLGGEMVFRLRVAVDRGANLDAPSSLSPAPVTVGGQTAAVAGRGSDEVTEPRENLTGEEDRPEHHP
jgi:uncharacterized membrane protein